MLKFGQKVRITPPANAVRNYPAFCKAFSGLVGKFIRPTLTSLDRKMYPEDFAIIGIGKKQEEFLTVDSRWLTTVS